MLEKSEILRRLKDCIVDCDIPGVERACREALASGLPAYEAVSNGLSKGMEIVGQKYEAGEYFLSDLLLAGEAMKAGMEILSPHFKTGELAGAIGKVVIGTVKGDLHDIGKNVVAMLLEAAGFEVTDLGIDVPAETFVRALQESKGNILGMSTLLTTTMPSMEIVIKELQKAGLRDRVKVIIGGAPVSPDYGVSIGADAAARDAVEGITLCKTWMEPSCKDSPPTNQPL